jgi:hypothetical protein
MKVRSTLIISIISLLLGVVEVMAGSVTREQARQRAEAFLKGKVISQEASFGKEAKKIFAGQALHSHNYLILLVLRRTSNHSLNLPPIVLASLR